MFGESHVDVIVSMYNLSELHRAAGREDEALKIQDEIVDIGERTAAAMGIERSDADEGAGKANKGAVGGAKDDDTPEESREAVESRATTWTPKGSKKQ